MPTPLPVAVLISGGGTTLRNLLEKQDQGELDIDVRLVIASPPADSNPRYRAAKVCLSRNVLRGRIRPLP